MGSDGDLLIDWLDVGIVVLTLNRPERRNAITLAMQRRLDDTLTALEADDAVRCIVLTGAGDAAFSAGYDVREMAPWSAEELLGSLEQREPWIWHIATTPVPIVA